MLHGFILVPYYFFATIAVLPLLMVLCRFIRLKPAINTLVGCAIALSLACIIIPLAADWIDLTAFNGRRMLVLGLLSFVFAAADAVLMRVLPLPLDQELDHL